MGRQPLPQEPLSEWGDSPCPQAPLSEWGDPYPRGWSLFSRGVSSLTRKPGLTTDVVVTHSLHIPDWTGATREEVLPASKESPNKGGAARTGKGPGQGGEDDAGN